MDNLIKKPPIEWFTLLHFGVGLLFGKMGLRTSYFVPIAVGWEVFEQKILAEQDEWWREPLLNSFIDVCVGTVGCYIGEKKLWRKLKK